MWRPCLLGLTLVPSHPPWPTMDPGLGEFPQNLRDPQEAEKQRLVPTDRTESTAPECLPLPHPPLRMCQDSGLKSPLPQPCLPEDRSEAAWRAEGHSSLSHDGRDTGRRKALQSSRGWSCRQLDTVGSTCWGPPASISAPAQSRGPGTRAGRLDPGWSSASAWTWPGGAWLSLSFSGTRLGCEGARWVIPRTPPLGSPPHTAASKSVCSRPPPILSAAGKDQLLMPGS